MVPALVRSQGDGDSGGSVGRGPQSSPGRATGWGLGSGAWRLVAVEGDQVPRLEVEAPFAALPESRPRADQAAFQGGAVDGSRCASHQARCGPLRRARGRWGARGTGGERDAFQAATGPGVRRGSLALPEKRDPLAPIGGFDPDPILGRKTVTQRPVIRGKDHHTRRPAVFGAIRIHDQRKSPRRNHGPVVGHQGVRGSTVPQLPSPQVERLGSRIP